VERKRGVTPPSAWGSTGADVPDLAGGYTLPPGDNGDLDRRNLLAAIVAALYSAVGSAQRAPKQADEKTNAVHQLVVATGALVASEADSFLTLISAGLGAPSQIHIRSIGELTTRIILCREYRDLALELYKTSAPAWTKIALKMGVTVPEIDRAERDMRALEMTQQFKIARADVIKRFHLPDDFQSSMLSKRSHGDVYALVEVSNNLRNREQDIRRAINKVILDGIAANILIHRATSITLAALVQVAAEFGMTHEQTVKSLFASYEQMQQRDKKTGALNIFPDAGLGE